MGPRRGPSLGSIAVLVAGLALTGALTGASVTIHRHNEDRLLSLELHQAASVLQAAVPSIQIPLSSTAEVVAATDGDPTVFRAELGRYVGAGSKDAFASASLWHLGTGPPTLVATVGLSPELPPGEVGSSFLTHARAAGPLAVVSLLSERSPGIGYATVPREAGSPWVVYAERTLPKHRQLAVTRNSAFSQLNYALYLGRTTSRADLLESSAVHFPLVGAQARASVPFGDTAITLVATANGELGGSLLARLPLIVALAGIFLSLVAGVLTDYLVRRRRQAEWLAAENRRMYSEQRSIAEVLQQALLPQWIPDIAGVETAVRYEVSGEGTEVGGDWYDIIPVDDSRFFFVL
ncbi:MAG: PP2C family protein-serine/threonine phosphatase, partial [Acidimicrobiales bacterium]